MNIQTFIGVVVTVVWGAGYIADIASDSFSPSPLVNGVMLIVAGAFLRVGIQKGNGNGESH